MSQCRLIIIQHQIFGLIKLGMDRKSNPDYFNYFWITALSIKVSLSINMNMNVWNIFSFHNKAILKHWPTLLKRKKKLKKKEIFKKKIHREKDDNRNELYKYFCNSFYGFYPTLFTTHAILYGLSSIHYYLFNEIVILSK